MGEIRILAVDDDEAVLRALRDRFPHYRWETAGDGLEALERLRQRRYDLLITDVRMPRMGGVELIEALSELEVQGLCDPHMAKIVLTGYGDEVAHERCMTERGAYRVAKPFDADLAQVIDRALEFAALRRAHTQRRQAELEQAREGRRRMEDRYLRLLESLPDIVYKVDPDGIFTFVNESVRMLGYEPADLIGQHFSTIVHPDDLPKVSRKEVLPRFAGQTTGDKAAPKLFDERRSRHRMTDALEVRFLRKTGRDEAAMIGSVSAYGEVLSAGEYDRDVRDPRKEFLGTVGIIRDVTDRKDLERTLRRLNESLESEVRQRTQELREKDQQLLHAQKMEAIGRLAGGLAHDFNNLLSVILGYADVAKRRLGPHERLHRDMNNIMDAARRAAALTRRLLAFSLRQTIQPRALDLNAVIGGMEPMLRRLIRENVKLEVDLEPRPYQVMADPSQIEQVVMNLVVNASDAIVGPGAIRIETRMVELVEGEIPPGFEIPPGPALRLRVRDDGQGMTPEVRQHIFEPFFTTKGPEQGTGLGLATVYGIVKQAKGCIACASAPGQGACFDIHLSSLGIPVAGVAVVEAPAEQGQQEGVVLLVEDEDMVRELARMVLEEAGYRVLPARNGGEALLLCERHGEPIDLVLTDVVMPMMSGPELVKRLAAIRPGIKALYMSGYAGDALDDFDLADGQVEFLPKPFDAQDLLKWVRLALPTM